ncbi:MAG: ribonuclease D [Chloroflexi bacterium]|nr:ribonuclease D [Chloroflexota bacterium]
MVSSLIDPIWVASPQALERLVEQLSQESRIAVDTESNSLFAYREQVCLIQFSTEQLDFLVDPLALRDLSILGPIFSDPLIEKIFHAAEYDLICMKRDFGFEFNNLFDTMHAARILGRPGLGLGTLLEEEFQIQVDKRMQRANWARRPLSPEMMMYARMDTHFLIPLREILGEQLRESGRLELAEEDFRRLTRVPAGSHENGSMSCWRIPGMQDLTPRQAAVMVELCAYREERARAANQPPFRILPNQVLLKIAQAMPRKRGELNHVAGLSPKLLDRHAPGLLAAVERGIVGPPAYRPVSKRPSDDVLWRLDSLRTWRKQTARSLGVESDVVLPRDVLETIAVRNPRSLDELAEIMVDLPFRLRRFGREILEALRQ